ncbi:MAG: aminopeptidase N [Panacagrimonas sp.]
MILRSDYRPPQFLLDRIDLSVTIAGLTTVEARLALRRSADANADAAGAPLVLDGRGMELVSLAIDGVALSSEQYRVDDEHLHIANVPDQFTLYVITRIDPERNTTLEGWYRSGPMLCTQCEAQGFSRITYALDRPDVLSRFRVRLQADASTFPVLLANGNLEESGTLDNGQHYAVWDDPFLKPCYLFAMVAGDLACVEDRYATASGRTVALKFYVDRGNEDRVDHAMESLKAAMRWDERVYGLEYDLDTYMVVAAREFNMGAMENKGLNLFNARFVLASAETATDEDFDGVESVIAHEYFHNWTGNRVTCRDWFQLSLKEGLTVFRDQCFSADLGSPDVSRIEHVRLLRAQQFTEDAGPTAHPVRPDAYAEVNNLYTATVYEKGAEILRMLHGLIGAQAFIQGIQIYLRRHDGTAATVEDLLAALEESGGRSLDGFRRWYSQAGTPQVDITDEYDPQNRRYCLKLKQHTAPLAAHAGKPPQALPIPIRFVLRDAEGRPLTVRAQPPLLPRADLILLETDQAEIVFDDIDDLPVPSFLHGFSAPVKLRFPHPPQALAQQVLNEDDGFLRWEAAQRLMLDALFERMAGAPGASDRVLLGTLQTLAANPPADKALLAEILRLPSAGELATQIEPLDPPRVAQARDALRHAIAQALTGPLSVWATWAPTERSADSRARRRLSNVALGYLAHLGVARIRRLALERAESGCMSLVMGAMGALRDVACEEREQSMKGFHARFRHDPLVLDKWFALEAASSLPGAVERVQKLLAHPDFQPSPNRVRAVLGSFMRENLAGFHRPDGSGYRLLAEQLGRIDRSNPQLSARLVDGMLGWRRLAEPFGGLMRSALESLAAQKPSKDLREKLDKALDKALDVALEGAPA